MLTFHSLSLGPLSWLLRSWQNHPGGHPEGSSMEKPPLSWGIGHGILPSTGVRATAPLELLCRLWAEAVCCYSMTRHTSPVAEQRRWAVSSGLCLLGCVTAAQVMLNTGQQSYPHGGAGVCHVPLTLLPVLLLSICKCSREVCWSHPVPGVPLAPATVCAMQLPPAGHCRWPTSLSQVPGALWVWIGFRNST